MSAGMEKVKFSLEFQIEMAEEDVKAARGVDNNSYTWKSHIKDLEKTVKRLKVVHAVLIAEMEPVVVVGPVVETYDFKELDG